jgi:hypothetical protein
MKYMELDPILVELTRKNKIRIYDEIITLL